MYSQIVLLAVVVWLATTNALNLTYYETASRSLDSKTLVMVPSVLASYTKASISFQKFDTDAQSAQAQRRLHAFVSTLRSFVNETSLDTTKLNLQSERLSKELTQLRESSPKHYLFSEFEGQLAFAKDLYNEMIDATRKLRHYQDFSIPGHRLVYKTIELSVRALVLNNLDGEFDTTTPGYIAKVIRYYHNLEFAVEKFKELSIIPYGTRQLFRTLTIRAGHILADLRNGIPVVDIWDLHWFGRFAYNDDSGLALGCDTHALNSDWLLIDSLVRGLELTDSLIVVPATSNLHTAFYAQPLLALQVGKIITW